MSRQRKWRVIFTLGILLDAVYLSFAQAADAPSGWKTECAGYYQLSLPAEVEVALLDMDDNGKRLEYVFPDGRKATYADWFKGMFPVTTPQPRSVFEKEISADNKGKIEYKKKLLAKGKPNSASRTKFYSDLMPETFRADWGGGGTSLYMQRDGRIYYHSIDNPYLSKTPEDLDAPPPLPRK